MLDAFAGLLVELHLGGCFWGDCSLSNVLYRYDAAAIEAVMVDAETSRLYDRLSTGQQREDLEIMTVNVAGEMADIAAEHGFDLDDADLALGSDIASRYWSLWKELDSDLVIGPFDRYRIRQRIAKLNDLGFAVEDVDLEPIDGGERVRLRTRVGGRTFHSQRLRNRTGIDASENQARAILSDITYHTAKDHHPTQATKDVAAVRWRIGVYEPLLVRIAEERTEDDPVQAFCDFLNHRYELASKQGRDVSNDEAMASWIEAGFPGYPL